MSRRIAVFVAAIVSLSLCSASGAEKAGASEPARSAKNVKQEANPQFAGLTRQIDELVKEFYPRAKIEIKGNTMHFEQKIRPFPVAGTRRHEPGPDLGGVLGDLELKTGRYQGVDKVPSQVNSNFHTTLKMAPYLKDIDSHLFVRFIYPPDAAPEFVDRLNKLLSAFGKSGDDTESVANAPEKSEPETPSSSTAAQSGDRAQTEAAKADNREKPDNTEKPDNVKEVKEQGKDAPLEKSATEKPTFNVARLSKYNYPEGRFAVLMPGKPAMEYSNAMGMRQVDYVYQEPHGQYHISYLILPGQAVPDRIPVLFDKLSQSFAKTCKGTLGKRTSINLRGYPGIQIELTKIQGKDDLAASLKIYVVRRYIYVIAASGTKPFVNSPVVEKFMDSLAVSPELTAAEQRAYDEAERKRKAEREKAEREAKWAADRRKSDERFNESRSRSRKEFERSRADFEMRRWRH